MILSAHFKRSEFACRCGCGFSDINLQLIDILEDVRSHFGVPVIVNSGCRCERHNHDVGGSPRSQHVLGNAADIQVKNITPQRVADYLESKHPGKFGIGRYRTFTHVDVRTAYARWGKNG